MLNSELGVKDIVENPKSIFYLLSEDEKEELQHHISLSHYKKNEFVFKEGDKPDGLYIIESGQAEVSRGDGKNIATLGDHDIFGELALIVVDKRTATVTAKTDLKVYRLNNWRSRWWYSYESMKNPSC